MSERGAVTSGLALAATFGVWTAWLLARAPFDPRAAGETFDALMLAGALLGVVWLTADPGDAPWPTTALRALAACAVPLPLLVLGWLLGAVEAARAAWWLGALVAGLLAGAAGVGGIARVAGSPGARAVAFASVRTGLIIGVTLLWRSWTA